MRAHLLWIAAVSMLFSGCGGSVEPPPAPEEHRAPLPQPAREELQPTPLPAKDVLFGLRSELPKMRSCLTEPGAIQLRWEVDKNGSARDFSVVWATNEQPAAVECLNKRVSERHFDVPDGATRGIAQWTFVRELPLDDKLGKRGARGKRKANRYQGVKFEPPGSLDSGEVDGVVEGGMRLYAHCLRAGVEAKSSISGRLALAWNVEADGRATRMADAGSDLGNQEVVDCAAECFYALEYPKPRAAPVRITYSLLFNED